MNFMLLMEMTQITKGVTFTTVQQMGGISVVCIARNNDPTCSIHWLVLTSI
jgi:hypothetical protein